MVNNFNAFILSSVRLMSLVSQFHFVIVFQSQESVLWVDSPHEPVHGVPQVLRQLVQLDCLGPRGPRGEEVVEEEGRCRAVGEVRVQHS